MSFFPAELIRKKRDGGAHSREELQFLIREYTTGNIPDYQMSAWMMAVVFKGMNAEEAHCVTQEMLHSGKTFDFSDIPAPKVDKHSTGGVGDKTSLILGPIVAAGGVAVPMIAGRGLGHTGGTLDKLEAIPGFSVGISEKKFREVLRDHGLCFMGQTDEICPADKKLYALRDVTGTVESVPLICASIMSKKLAEGLDGLVLDIKFGSGAFMKTPEQAEHLALALKDIGERGGKSVHALLTSMDQPLGSFCGNSLEVKECLRILGNETLRPAEDDTRELSLLLAAHMLWIAKKAPRLESALVLAESLLVSGKALTVFKNVVRAQGGDLERIPMAQKTSVIRSPRDGYLERYDVERIGYAAIELKAGRRASTDTVDSSSGIEFHVRLGEAVKTGDPVFTLYSDDISLFKACEDRLQKAYSIGSKATSPGPWVYKTLT